MISRIVCLRFLPRKNYPTRDTQAKYDRAEEEQQTLRDEIFLGQVVRFMNLS